jgi:phosphoribosylanthranilate isomerase
MDEIAFLNEMNVDYIGFVFAKSRRRVTRDQAREMRTALKKDIAVVGVFVNEDPAVINDIADYCGLDIVQMHGDESREDMRRIRRPVWNAVGVKTEADIQAVERLMKEDEPIAQAILLDYRDPGSGQTFDWFLIPKERNYQLVLAGGIHPGNVEMAMDLVDPDVIDVSSGVEKNGKKAKDLVEAMIRRVKTNAEE